MKARGKEFTPPRQTSLSPHGQNWKSITEVAETMFKEFINWFPKEELDDFEHAIFIDEDVDSRLAETFLKVKSALIN